MTDKIKARIPALRLFIEARRQCLATGVNDNQGAIHSVERLLDIMGQRLRYPFVRHINNLKQHEQAEYSLAAFKQRGTGAKLYIEHVMPQRAFARLICDKVEQGISDEELMQFVKDTYRLVVLTAEETRLINKQNRSKITQDRIADAGIKTRQAR